MIFTVNDYAYYTDFFRPTWAEISLDALQHNIEAIRNIIPNTMKLMAVVKADAYGHGAIHIAKHAVQCGIDYLAVAFLDEALELRQAGITFPILIMGYTPPEAVHLAIQHNISFTVFSHEVLDAIEQCNLSKLNERQAIIHIKIDTGMNRVGIRFDDDATGLIDRALQLPGVRVEGLFTHYASADEADKSFTRQQHQRFKNIIDHYEARNITFPFIHAGNSATAIDTPELSCNMVRIGVSLYGFYPSAEINRHKIALQPVMTFKTQTIMVKTLPPDNGIGYGLIYRTQAEEQIATVPVGYADGYARLLSERGEVLIRGQRVPIAGRISMDQTTINVSAIDEPRVGEEVILFGQQGAETICAGELAEKLETIHYEITCKIAHRVPRVYYYKGQRVSTLNRMIRSNE